jgi:hypothetical protein
MSVVEVWREPSRQWRWRYLEPPGEGTPAVDLLSNEVYERRDAAVEAAMTAYPGVPVRELTPPDAAPRQRRRGGRVRSRGRLLTLLGLAAALLALRWRRREGDPSTRAQSRRRRHR